MTLRLPTRSDLVQLLLEERADELVRMFRRLQRVPGTLVKPADLAAELRRQWGSDYIGWSGPHAATWRLSVRSEPAHLVVTAHKWATDRDIEDIRRPSSAVPKALLAWYGDRAALRTYEETFAWREVADAVCDSLSPQLRLFQLDEEPAR